MSIFGRTPTSPLPSKYASDPVISHRKKNRKRDSDRQRRRATETKRDRRISAIYANSEQAASTIEKAAFTIQLNALLADREAEESRQTDRPTDRHGRPSLWPLHSAPPFAPTEDGKAK